MIGLMKDKFDEEIFTNFVGLRAKVYCYLIDASSEDKISKMHEKVHHKKKT